MNVTTSEKQQDEENKPAGDVLLIVFIHGFKGTESTFENFPSRLQHVLSESERNLSVEYVVFPAYETKGELNAAVVRFADWLTTLTVQREVAHGGGAGGVKIVLCGHSMGGLLAADSLLEFINSRPDRKAPLWPRIIACIAFDTPYLGIHPFVFKNSATRAVEYADAARGIVTDVYSVFKGTTTATPPPNPALRQITAGTSETSSASAWAKWAPAAYAIGGAVLAGATAGAAYMRRDDITSGYTWASDHMRFVGSLWDEKAMHQRLDDLLAADTDHGIIFKTFYLFLPASPPTHPDPRTFVVLPSRSSPVFTHYVPSPNCVVQDEVQAHMGMFKAGNNDGYYRLGLETVQVIRQALGRCGTQSDHTQQTPQGDSVG
ncbi:hypothetical protein L210DRAFT_283686 [Boletus edulis BED1]|uniref:DUF676 domain-containing protein n=1 Tax=Boletus edulis BED1 TaxID=1328754 RepID=A0AAD4C6F9_BOLED|nr:hypothetical protein L210DRAFT_283686 [Boletus edulis BED1]